ncbi:NADP-dependent oxidoreductase domain-containing protein [Cyathus striatus]|nr:NADP-dependent oxidoreductase domain-containing protein [Cyathus striatus]
MSSYPTRKIGATSVSAIGLGLMGIGAFYGTTGSDEERFKVLDTALERGCNFWDTANMYGDSEELIGQWFKYSGKRDQVFLATKCGYTSFTGQITDRLINGEPEFIRAEFEKSISKLCTNRVDLYYLHRADPTIPIEKSVEALAKLVKEGKVNYIGLSEVSAETLRRAHAVHPIAAVQMEYSPFVLDAECEKYALLKTCRELGVKLVAYSPLGRGMLTGQLKSPKDFEEGDIRKYFPRFNEENFPKSLALVDKIKTIGVKCNATPGQVSLAWLLAQGEDIIPIPGTKRVQYLEENLGAANLHLSDEDIVEVRAVAEEADKTLEGRYPAAVEFLLFVNTPAL